MIVIPPRSILAAVDFSEPSRVALRFAARLATQCTATLHVLHAADPLLAAAADAEAIDLAGETREELERFTANTSPRLNRTSVHLHVIVGDSVPVICNLAAREQVDLIVVGAHGMSRVARAMFGSTTEGVLRCAGVSVLVVPDTWTPPQEQTDDLAGMGPVVAAIEGSCTALGAAQAAYGLAQALGTSMHAVHVVPAMPVLERWRSHASAAVNGRAERERREIHAALAGLKPSVPIPLHVEIGPVPERLAGAASIPGTHPILVLGRRSRARRAGAPGATAYRVLSLSRVPVLVHPPREMWKTS